MKLKEIIFRKIWSVLYDNKQTYLNDPDTRHILKRLYQFVFFKEPDYDRMWMQICRKTVGRKSHIWLRKNVIWYAAVLLPILVISSVFIYLKPDVNRLTKDVNTVVVDKAVRLTLADGKMIDIPRDKKGDLFVDEKVAIRCDTGAMLLYEMMGVKGDGLQYNKIEIPTGADYQLKLSDGSIVFLNSNSSLRYPIAFAGKERKVFLEGEGYFEVKGDSEHPFVVNVNGVEIRAVGTRFNINAYPERKGVETTLAEGKVLVGNGEHEVLLRPGQQAFCFSNEIEVKEVDCREYISWKDGLFIFNKMSLDDIMIQIERWYGLNVFFRNEALKNHTFTGMIDKNLPALETFQAIEKTVDVHFRIRGQTVVVE